jgi:hypothetical protein
VGVALLCSQGFDPLNDEYSNGPTLFLLVYFSTVGRVGLILVFMVKKIFFLMTMSVGMIFPTIAQNVPAYVPTNGLVGWWPFNGNANDESGNGNHGTVNGATLTADRNVKFNFIRCNFFFLV